MKASRGNKSDTRRRLPGIGASLSGGLGAAGAPKGRRIKPSKPIRVEVEIPDGAHTSWEEMVASPRWARIAVIIAEIAQNPKKEDAA